MSGIVLFLICCMIMSLFEGGLVRAFCEVAAAAAVLVDNIETMAEARAAAKFGSDVIAAVTDSAILQSAIAGSEFDPRAAAAPVAAAAASLIVRFLLVLGFLKPNDDMSIVVISSCCCTSLAACS
jgi:hypothetical protein